MAVPAPGNWSRADARAPSAIGATTDLATAIDDLARHKAISIGTDGPLPHINVRAAPPDQPTAQTLATLLNGTGYRARQVAPTAWRIERATTIPAPRPTPPAPVALPPPPPINLPPIVVTATKQPLNLYALPASVSLVALTDFPVGSGVIDATPDIARRIDGLALTALGPGRNRMFLRGVADSAFGGESQSTVAVVLDETRLTYAAPDPDLRLIDMLQVEVLKGPQGSLYGTGPLGGIYRMVSHQADLNASDTSMSAAGSIGGHGGAGYAASFVRNMPIAAGSAAVRVVGYAELAPGWVDTGNRTNANATHVYGGRVQLGIAPAAGWRLDVTTLAQWLNSSDSRYTYDRGQYDRPAQLPEPHDNDLSHAAARLHGTIGAVDVTVSSGMTWHEVADSFDATTGADNAGATTPTLLTDRHNYKVWDSELRLRGQLGNATWLIGLSHLDASQRLDRTLSDRTQSSLVLETSRRDSHDSAAYFDLTVPVIAHLSVEGGGRLYRASIADDATLSGLSASTERERAGFTPSLALSWAPGDDRIGYVRYGSAFRQGAAAPFGGKTPDGDELASIEAGWRQRVGSRGRIDLSLWYSRWDHVQSDSLGDAGQIVTVEAGDARIWGAEGSIALPLTPGWSMEAGGNITDARLSRDMLGFELHDSRLPVVPSYTVRAALLHDFVIGDMTGKIYFNLRYVGPAHMSFDPALDRNIGKLVESDLEASIRDGAWTFTASARNLFAARGRAFAYGNPLRYRLTEQYITQDPLALGVAATLAF